MVILKKIWDFLANPNNQRLILFISLIIAGIIFLQTCNKNNQLKQEKFRLENNQAALLDTIKIIKNKAGELQSEKLSFITTNKELKELSSTLYNEVLKQKEKVFSLTIINASLQSNINALSDSIHNLKYKPIFNSNNNIYSINWDFNKTFNEKNYRILEGYTNVEWDSVNRKILNRGTILNKEELKFNIITGFTEEDSKLKIFVKSDYPDLKFDNIEGSLIDPNKSDIIKKLMKPKRWSFGPSVGYGMILTPTGIKTGLFVGVNLQYRMFSF